MLTNLQFEVPNEALTMEEWKNRFRMTAMMNRGIVDDALFTKATELDAALIKLAGRILSNSEKIVFALIYACKPRWDDIREIALQRLNKEWSEETAKKYALDADEKIANAACNCRELTEWERGYRRDRTKTH